MTMSHWQKNVMMTSVRTATSMTDAAPPNAEEGVPCPSCSAGILAFRLDGDCCCHINPPCFACTEAKLACSSCGEEFE
jgi:hypothetical protein